MAASMAFAQTTTAPGRQFQGRKAGVQQRVQRRMMQALDLSAAQKEQLKSIRQSTQAQVQPLAQQLKTNRQALNAAVQASDTAKIQQLSATIGTLQGQVLALRSAGRVQFLAVLTPDQKAKMTEFRGKVKQLLGGRKG